MRQCCCVPAFHVHCIQRIIFAQKIDVPTAAGSAISPNAVRAQSVKTARDPKIYGTLIGCARRDSNAGPHPRFADCEHLTGLHRDKRMMSDSQAAECCFARLAWTVQLACQQQARPSKLVDDLSRSGNAGNIPASDCPDRVQQFNRMILGAFNIVDNYVG
jgi:hypothetical protein